MSKNSDIQWTDHTFNPWEGCQRVSPGCENCYAETRNGRFHEGKHWGPPSTTKRLGRSEAYWREPLKWNAEALRSGVRRRVFCASLADVFEAHPDVEGWRARLFKMIEATPALDWLLLTKRPENIDAMLPANFRHWSRHSDEPRPNIWLGTTAEDQRRADERIPVLLDINAPGVVRFISAEPLLGSVDIARYLKPTLVTRDGRRLQHPDPAVGKNGGRWSWGLDWVIVGGESGAKARGFFLEWADRIVAQCRAEDVACFVKQMGARPHGDHAQRLVLVDRHGGDMTEWPERLRVRQFPGIAVPFGVVVDVTQDGRVARVLC